LNFLTSLIENYKLIIFAIKTKTKKGLSRFEAFFKRTITFAKKDRELISTLFLSNNIWNIIKIK